MNQNTQQQYGIALTEIHKKQNTATHTTTHFRKGKQKIIQRHKNKSKCQTIKNIITNKNKKQIYNIRRSRHTHPNPKFLSHTLTQLVKQKRKNKRCETQRRFT